MGITLGGGETYYYDTVLVSVFFGSIGGYFLGIRPKAGSRKVAKWVWEWPGRVGKAHIAKIVLPMPPKAAGKTHTLPVGVTLVLVSSNVRR